MRWRYRLLDMISFIKDFGWIQGAMVLGLMLLAAILWRDMKALATEYRLALKRIEVLEQSILESGKIICRSECLDLLRSIDQNVKKFI